MAEKLAELNNGVSYKVKYGHATNVADGGSARYPLGISDDANRRILVLSATEKGSEASSICLPYRGRIDDTWWIKLVLSNDMSAIPNKTISIDYAYIEF